MPNLKFLEHVKSGGDISKYRRVNDKGDSALIVACRSNYVEIAKALVERGVSVNEDSFSNSSPLTASAMRGYQDLVTYLLEKKANVNNVTNSGDTPLSLAIWKNHPPVALKLLEAKADASRIDSFGDTVLVDACKGGDLELVKKLLETGQLKIDHQNNEGLTPLMCCALQRHEDVGIYLLDQKADPNLLERNGSTVLHFASAGIMEKFCRALLAAKADPLIADNNGRTPRQVARSEDIANLFPAESANGRSPRSQRDMAALIAPPYDDTKFIEMVKNGKVDITAERWRFGDNRERPLIRACRLGNLEWVQLLVKAKAEPDELNNKGASPLIAASMRGFTPICKFLIEKCGARVNAVTKTGDSPLSLCCWKGHSDTAIYLINQKADVKRVDSFGDNCLIDAVKQGMVDVVKALCETKLLDLSHKNNEGVSALFYAVEGDMVDVVKVLIEQKASLDKTTDPAGNTPLIVAAQKGNGEICKVLLDAKANPNHCNIQGNDAVTCAAPQVRGLFLSLRLKRQQSFEVDENIGWGPGFTIERSMRYICNKQKNENLLTVCCSQLEQHCCAKYIGDLFTVDPNTWESMQMPKRFKAMLMEIVRIARTKELSKEEEVKDHIRKLEYQNRVDTLRTKRELYKAIVEIAIADEVLTSDELKKIEDVRLKQGLSSYDHDLVLSELKITKQQYHQFTQNQLATAGAEKKKEDVANLMTCVVCRDARSDHVLIPCMHLCLCGDCAPFYKAQQRGLNCPKCRTSVTDVLKVFI